MRRHQKTRYLVRALFTGNGKATGFWMEGPIRYRGLAMATVVRWILERGATPELIVVYRFHTKVHTDAEMTYVLELIDYGLRDDESFVRCDRMVLK